MVPADILMTCILSNVDKPTVSLSGPWVKGGPKNFHHHPHVGTDLSSKGTKRRQTGLI